MSTTNPVFRDQISADVGTIEPWCRSTRKYTDRVLNREIDLEGAFECPVPPPEPFLRWLIDRSDLLAPHWPESRKGVKRVFGESTQRLRDAMINSPHTEKGLEVKNLAQAELLSKGILKSQRKWWAFEGYTEVDCLIETDKLVLFVEGKRTEPISAATDWYPQRNQIARNLESAQEFAMMKGKEFAVLVVAEKKSLALEVATGSEALRLGLPHLDKEQADEMLTRFLGIVLWEDLRDPLELGQGVFPNVSSEVL
ncbi:MAG: hypothetical protein WD342_06020 [Verrucomicrobiales bacterium]